MLCGGECVLWVRGLARAGWISNTAWLDWAFQGEQVDGSMDFWCGASGNLRIAGPAADWEKPSDANRRWRRSRAWLGGLRKVGSRGKARSLPGRSPFPPCAGPVLPPAIACCPVISSCGVARTQLDRGPAPAALMAFTRWTWRTPAVTLALQGSVIDSNRMAPLSSNKNGKCRKACPR